MWHVFSDHTGSNCRLMIAEGARPGDGRKSEFGFNDSIIEIDEIDFARYSHSRAKTA
jgi:hypothetical protein